MSIPFSGVLSRSGGITSAINSQLKTITLKPVKKVSFQFDPFHEKVEETRFFMYYITSPKVLKTNLSCSVKTEVLSNRSDPSITFNLANGEKVIFKSANLTALEMFKLYNKHITVLAPKEVITGPSFATKASKKISVTKKPGKK